MTPRWTDEQVRSAVAAATSYPAALEQLGCVNTSAAMQRLQQRIRMLGLSTEHFVRVPRPARRRTRWSDDQLREAVASAQSYAQAIRALGLVPAGGNFVQVQRRIRELALDTSRAPDGRIPVELDHINGDTHDNRLVNLRIVCPNCHALQPTHRGLNQQRRKR